MHLCGSSLDHQIFWAPRMTISLPAEVGVKRWCHIDARWNMFSALENFPPLVSLNNESFLN
jgi:hypothetical protein